MSVLTYKYSICITLLLSFGAISNACADSALDIGSKVPDAQAIKE